MRIGADYFVQNTERAVQMSAPMVIIYEMDLDFFVKNRIFLY